MELFKQPLDRKTEYKPNRWSLHAATNSIRLEKQSTFRYFGNPRATRAWTDVTKKKKDAAIGWLPRRERKSEEKSITWWSIGGCNDRHATQGKP